MQELSEQSAHEQPLLVVGGVAVSELTQIRLPEPEREGPPQHLPQCHSTRHFVRMQFSEQMGSKLCTAHTVDALSLDEQFDLFQKFGVSTLTYLLFLRWGIQFALESLLELGDDTADKGIRDSVDLADLHGAHVFFEVVLEDLHSLLQRFLLSLFEKGLGFLLAGVIRVGSVGELLDDLLFLLSWQFREQLGVEEVVLWCWVLLSHFLLLAL